MPGPIGKSGENSRASSRRKWYSRLPNAPASPSDIAARFVFAIKRRGGAINQRKGEFKTHAGILGREFDHALGETARDDQIFCPLMTNPDAVRVALVRIAAMSEPALGSDHACAQISSPRAILGR